LARPGNAQVHRGLSQGGQADRLDCVGTFKDYVQARTLLESACGQIDPALLADHDVALKERA
jgi:3-phenylpropionate/trans-cinnamate dioxygenase ferredoxin reductase component